MNKLYSYFVTIPLALLCFHLKAEVIPLVCDTFISCDSLANPVCLAINSIPSSHEILKLDLQDSVVHSRFRSKKILAAVLAFPVPFGLLGLHRIFLGTKPYIPFVYMGTLGGCFLILPIIDFIAILSANESSFAHFENNPKVFMWEH